MRRSGASLIKSRRLPGYAEQVLSLRPRWYSLASRSGANLDPSQDLSGNGFHRTGTVGSQNLNQPAIVPGLGPSVQFNGNGWWEYPAAVLNCTQPFVLCCWIKESGGDQKRCVISKNASSGTYVEVDWMRWDNPLQQFLQSFWPL